MTEKKKKAPPSYSSPWKPRIRAFSEKMQKKLREYEKIKKQWKKDHSMCECGDCQSSADDVHHIRGRAGDLLCDTRYWMAVCRRHHDWIGRWPDDARRMGWLAPLGKWGVQDKDHETVN